MSERYSTWFVRESLEVEITRLRRMLTEKQEALLQKIETARENDKTRTRDEDFLRDALDVIKRTLDKNEGQSDV